MRSRSIMLTIALLTALAVPAVSAARPSKGATTTVNVQAKDFSFALSRSSVPHGQVVFVIKNAGKTTHDFSIEGHTSKIIWPGAMTKLTIMLSRPGTYPYRCTVDAHAQLGMKGVLRVS